VRLILAMADSALDTTSATNFADPISTVVFSNWYTGADFLNIVGSRSRQVSVSIARSAANKYAARIFVPANVLATNVRSLRFTLFHCDLGAAEIE
jgi:hypothetical protein